ncbi:acetyl-CoA hydrolase/transferase family protein [Desulfatitalea tepidiphila]|uniref:acetyl-CoA hydrolase/transferase family protein n=1 Tax=Desulfatitalea tepidiphila TaxID=1185843 RepID=UPI0006B406C1|nr:acetyl-CoA hydrolase/transferase C-terminal domain-containing protein [Desulfatitalea tepidiphila]
MDWNAYIKERSISVDEAAGLIKSGDRIISGTGGGTPEAVYDAIVQRAAELHNVEIVHMVSYGKGLYCLPEYENSFRHNAMFAGPKQRAAIQQGRADFTAAFLSDYPKLIRKGVLPIDVALMTVSPPDKVGNVSLGISVDYSLEAALNAKKVIVEVSPLMPKTYGNTFIHVTQIDHFILSNRPMLPLPANNIGVVEKTIAANVADLIQDGDCLQLGFGQIPDAILQFIEGKQDLGIHSEMISDGVMKLVEKGIVTCRRKNFHRGKMIFTFALGSADLYEWMNENSMIEMHPVDYTNNPCIIGKNDNMLSVNSALAVDLLGQIAADAIGPMQFSGVGGQVDFVRGCRISTGGRSIIAMPATAASGTKSRIVAAFEKGQAITTTRAEVDYIVTEYGVANIWGRKLSERVAALTAIAAPQFREDLRREFSAIYR